MRVRMSAAVLVHNGPIDGVPLGFRASQPILHERC